MFNIGDFVVKPNTGICKINDIVRMSLTGKEKKKYFELSPIEDNRAKLYVSIDADRTRLRHVMTKEETQDFIEKINEIEPVFIPNDKMREQQYKEAFKTNEPEALVAIMKNLHARSKRRLAQGKKITSTDERYSKQAEKALYSELAFALEADIREIERIITEKLENE